MTLENSKVIDLNVKKEDRVLDFSDFQKQEIKFDIEKLQEAYHQIVKIKKLTSLHNILRKIKGILAKGTKIAPAIIFLTSPYL